MLCVFGLASKAVVRQYGAPPTALPAPRRGRVTTTPASGRERTGSPRWCLAAAQLGPGAKESLNEFRAANPTAMIAVTGEHLTAFTDQRPHRADLFGPHGVVPVEDGDTSRAARLAAVAAIIARHYGVSVDGEQALPLITALDMPPEKRQEFITSCLGPLHTSGRHRYLLDTLNSYLAHNLCVTAAARSLYVHRHTFTYRLRSIEHLAGLDLGNPYDRLRAELALILSRTSYWPVPRRRAVRPDRERR
ncbi:PucR family transcriptional regulator [Streptomyces flavalbus]|uniref:PucR family transcriptional regulator n=1 Tax=Streptomyces flavalbus TaxID=2665155 RepID=A0ABW2WES6_9ACTN